MRPVLIGSQLSNVGNDGSWRRIYNDTCNGIYTWNADKYSSWDIFISNHFVTANATFFQSYANYNVDIVLSALMIFGGVIGAQIGVIFGLN